MDDAVGDMGKVQQNHDQIRLLASNSFLLFLAFWSHICVPILDQFLSFRDKCTNIVEFMLVDWVREDLIPWSTLEGSLWQGCIIKILNCVRIVVLESEIVSHVLLLVHKNISLGELDSIEEVREVLVHLN